MRGDEDSVLVGSGRWIHVDLDVGCRRGVIPEDVSRIRVDQRGDRIDIGEDAGDVASRVQRTYDALLQLRVMLEFVLECGSVQYAVIGSRYANHLNETADVGDDVFLRYLSRTSTPVSCHGRMLL